MRQLSDIGLVKKPYNWHTAMMEMAYTISKMSKDPRTKVGAVLVSPDGFQCSFGWNGFPKRFPDEQAVWENRLDPTKILKYDVVIHAEINALLNCPTRPFGWHMYCTHHPCSRCAAMLVQAGISIIYFDQVPDPTIHRTKEAKDIFSKSGVACHNIKDIR